MVLHLFVQRQLLRQGRVVHWLEPLTSSAFFLFLQRRAQEDVVIFVV